jgi:FKBP12-rapamycin complex-associated protein
LNEEKLRKEWDVYKKTTKEDWVGWMRRFSMVLVNESPEPAIRYCVELGSQYYPLIRELFNAAFISCWNALSKPSRGELIESLR